MPLRGTAILFLWRGPSPRAYSRGIISHGLSYRCGELCLFEALQSSPFGAALLQGPTRRGLSHMGFHTAATNCASSRHSILRLWRGPSPRAYSRGLSHIDFHAAATNCASSRHSILRLWRGPSPRAYSRGLSHIGFHAAATNCASSRHCNPLPLARPFSKGLCEEVMLLS